MPPYGDFPYHLAGHPLHPVCFRHGRFCPVYAPVVARLDSVGSSSPGGYCMRQIVHALSETSSSRNNVIARHFGNGNSLERHMHRADVVDRPQRRLSDASAGPASSGPGRLASHDFGGIHKLYHGNVRSTTARHGNLWRKACRDRACINLASRHFCRQRPAKTVVLHKMLFRCIVGMHRGGYCAALRDRTECHLFANSVSVPVCAMVLGRRVYRLQFDLHARQSR